MRVAWGGGEGFGWRSLETWESLGWRVSHSRQWGPLIGGSSGLIVSSLKGEPSCRMGGFSAMHVSGAICGCLHDRLHTLLCCFGLLTTTPTRAPRRPSLLPPHTYADSYMWGGLLRTALGCNHTSFALSRACMLKVSCPYHSRTCMLTAIPLPASFVPAAASHSNSYRITPLVGLLRNIYLYSWSPLATTK